MGNSIILGEDNLTDDFIKAVGRLTINFSHLEFSFSLFCGSQMGIKEPINEIITSELSFKQIVNITSGIFREIEKDPEMIEQFNKILASAWKLEEERNKIIHSFYGRGDEPNDKIIRHKHSSKFKKGFKKDYQEVDAIYVNKISDEIKMVSIRLMQFLFNSIK